MKRRFRPKQWLFLVAGALLTVTAMMMLLYWFLSRPINRTSEEKVSLVIPAGSSGVKIAALLKENNLIRSEYVFQFVVWKKGLLKKLQAGTFELSPSQSTQEIALALTEGTNDVWVTIPEGLRAEEIGELLENELDGFQRSDEAYEPECLNYEGFLFPETYLLPRLYTATQTCRLLRQEYGRQVPMEMRERIHQAGRTEEEIITMASIVQREAKSLEDMKIVAGILWKRIEIGMPLQVDATLQYVKGYDEARKTWWAPPTAADKVLDSPYNTYQNPGLPPGPISNPGLDAILAALNPTSTQYLFYISNTDGSKMYYAETYEEHQRNINQYLR